ncbi:MAG TPA: sortase [Verrucomicrobiae bacterium]|nr:sortase [Verrucomicrobiae bacterium]
MDNPFQDNPLFQNLQPKRRVVEPLPEQTGKNDNPAVDLIRQKIGNLYIEEPNAKEELVEAKAAGKKRSKHQQFLYEISQSGKPLAEIQKAWHTYYQELPDKDKHEVWQEFYEDHQPKHTKIEPHHTETKPSKPDKPVVHPQASAHVTTDAPTTDLRSVSDVKDQLLGRIQKRGTAKKGHLQSLLFGLGLGAVAVVILLFGFFNERFIAPFITPSKSVSNSPIIIDPASTTVGTAPTVLIPKINAELPVVYDEPSVSEAAVQKALERGVVHYATTPGPGELGNGVIFGHSSNNILNKGQYKFAFVLLHRLEIGDTFMIQKDSKRYIYRIFEKKVVKPTEVAVLGKTTKAATFTLITCDPPGTSINRLVVIGEQISPDPASNIASTIPQDEATQPQELPSNSPSLWQRITSWFTS